MIFFHLVVCISCFQARERDASAYEKRIGNEMSESLRKLIEPHFLRRTKAMVLQNNKTETDGVDESVESEEGTSLNYSSKYGICCHTYMCMNLYALFITYS